MIILLILKFLIVKVLILILFIKALFNNNYSKKQSILFNIY